MTSLQKTPYESYKTRKINRERMESLLRFAGESILDVGCGNGAYVLELADQYKIAGVDYQSFPTWSEKPELFSISDATQLDFEDNSIDTITSFELLEHLLEPQKVLEEFYRVSRKNLILTVPNCEITPGMKHSNLIYNHWSDRTHVNFFTMRSITDIVEKAGFKVETSGYINRLRINPFLSELFGYSNRWSSFLLKSLLKQQQKSYYLTCLLVAAKR